MFVKINRTNTQNHERELVVNTEEIAFVSETEPIQVPVEFEEHTDNDTGVVVKIPTKWEDKPNYIIGFKNGKHPQFLDKANYDKLIAILLK